MDPSWTLKSTPPKLAYPRSREYHASLRTHFSVLLFNLPSPMGAGTLIPLYMSCENIFSVYKACVEL
jgi:hypothetical protein